MDGHGWMEPAARTRGDGSLVFRLNLSEQLDQDLAPNHGTRQTAMAARRSRKEADLPISLPSIGENGSPAMQCKRSKALNWNIAKAHRKLLIVDYVGEIDRELSKDFDETNGAGCYFCNRGPSSC